MITRSCVLAATLLVAACTGSPQQDNTAAQPDNVPEINLNLPSGDCACDAPQNDFTFLERGFVALEEGAYLDALQHFQRYQRTESSELATIESGISIAYLGILPESPIYDRDEARQNYIELRSNLNDDMQLHREVQLMRDAMEAFLELSNQIDRLKQSNGSLRAELDKREEAIKRLRDLTLGESEPAGLLGN